MSPLRGLRVLVTRPAEQALRLSDAIAAEGGEARIFSSLAIEAVCPPTPPAESGYEWLVFLSAHAVRHGLPWLGKQVARRTIAIGRATAHAAQEAGCAVDLVPPAPHTSETLFAMPEFVVTAGARVLIVRGEGGRDTLDQSLGARGVGVDSLVVYRRIPAACTDAERQALEADWLDAGIDIVTATSVDTLTRLQAQLSPTGRQLLQQAPLLVASPRIAAGARELGLMGECVLAPAADDASLVGALAHWHTRAR